MRGQAGWSPEVQVLRRPFASYRALASEPSPRGIRLLLRRAVLQALFLGGIVSLSTSGRFTLRLILGGAVAWAFVPALQVASMAVIVGLLGRGAAPLPRAVDLYFVGQGPWLLWLLAWTALATALPVPQSYALTGTWGLWLSLAVAVSWSTTVRAAFFREVLALRGSRVLGALLLHTCITWGAVILFFQLSDQLWPRMVSE